MKSKTVDDIILESSSVEYVYPMQVRGKNFGLTNLGMTLRDHFAGQAMQSVSSGRPGLTDEEIAAEAYRLADAMIAARGAA